MFAKITLFASEKVDHESNVSRSTRYRAYSYVMRTVYTLYGATALARRSVVAEISDINVNDKLGLIVNSDILINRH